MCVCASYYGDVLTIGADSECNDLPNPDNGIVSYDSRLEGSIAQYSCNVGFVLEGQSTRLCQGNGTWSGEEPTCEGEYL